MATSPCTPISPYSAAPYDPPLTLTTLPLPRRRSMVVPEYIRPEYYNGTFIFVHDLDGQIGQGATSYVWQKALQYYRVP